jgi:membrane-associated phospholipid phosphatase
MLDALMTARTEKALLVTIVGATLVPLFAHVSFLARAHPVQAPAWLSTQFDRHLPLFAPAVWIYLSWYLAAFGVLLGDRATFRRAVGAYTLSFMACLAGWFFLPVSIERPIIGEPTGITEAALCALYAADPPVNLFPSFHAAVAAILWRLCPASPFISFTASVWVLVLCGSCVLTKQHYVLDVLAGLGVGASALLVVDSVRRWSPYPRLRAAIPATPGQLAK